MRLAGCRLQDTVAALAIVGYCAVLLAFAKTDITTGLDSDRYGFMESLVERHTACVDGSSMRSIDWICIGGHFYSSKPPLLNVLGAGVYFVLYHGLGWSFRETPHLVVRVLLSVFVTIPLGLLLWQFWRFVSRREGISPCTGIAMRVTALLAFASLLLPYALVFTNHVLAAALLFGAFVFASRIGSPTWGGMAAFLTGFLSTTSAAVDLIAGTVFFLAVAAVGWRRMTNSQRLALAAGAFIPTALHMTLNRVTLGTWATGYLIKGSLEYPGSPWIAQVTGEATSFRAYCSGLYHYLFGHGSVLVLQPLAVAGACCAVGTLRKQVTAAGVGAVAALVFTVLLVPKFSIGLGGSLYGPRHIIPVLPLLYAFLSFEFVRDRSFVRKAGLLVLIVWSVFIAAIGTLNPRTQHDFSVYAPLDVLAEWTASRGSSGFAEAVIRTTAPNAAHGFSKLGLLHWQAGRSAEAIAAFERALQIEPNRGEALYGLGIAAKQSGRLPLARRMFEHVTAQEPGNAWAWGNLSLVLFAEGNRESARQAADRGAAADPNNAAVRQSQSELTAGR